MVLRLPQNGAEVCRSSGHVRPVGVQRHRNAACSGRDAACCRQQAVCGVSCCEDAEVLGPGLFETEDQRLHSASRMYVEGKACTFAKGEYREG